MGRLDLRPLTGRYEAGAVFETQVARHDPEFGLATLSFQGGELRVPYPGLPRARACVSASARAT